MTDLLPCPMCDKAARLFQEGRNYEHKPLFHVRCKRSRCELRTKNYLVPKKAITAWNTRADTERVTVIMPLVTDSEKVKALREGLRMQQEDCAILQHVNVELRKLVKVLEDALRDIVKIAKSEQLTIKPDGSFEQFGDGEFHSTPFEMGCGFVEIENKAKQALEKS